MTKVEVTVEKEKQDIERGRLLEPVRKLLLASVGAVALAQDEAEDLVKRLVERGELAEKDGKNLVQDLIDKRRSQVKRTESDLDKRIEEVIAHMNVPTKADLEALSAKIAALTRKVEELKKG